MHTDTQIAIGFVEGRVCPAAFAERLYASGELDELFSDPTANPSSGSTPALYALVALNYAHAADIYDARVLVAEALTAHGFTVQLPETAADEMNLQLAIEPSWARVTDRYFAKLRARSGSRKGVDLESWFTAEMRVRFRCLARRPRWLQAPDWVYDESGEPLSFVGQLDVTALHHDTTFVYVFVDRCGAFSTIIQSM